eukprot:g27815.t1
MAQPTQCGGCRAVSVPMIAAKQAKPPTLIRVAAAAAAATGREAAAALPLQQLDDVRHRVQAEFWSAQQFRGLCKLLQEATPTFKMEVAFASGAKSDEKAKAKAKALSQMAGELCTAAVEGDLPTLQQLLQAGHVVNAGDYDRRTAIHIAASEGNKQVVAYLLSQSADPTARDRWGHTALDEATRAGHREVVELLTEHSPPTDTAGFTRQASGMEQAAMLCSAAATGWTAQIEKLLASRADPSAADYDQRTPLHVACSHRNAQVVRMLLEAKASYNAHDAFGRTPVDEALTNHDLDEPWRSKLMRSPKLSSHPLLTLVLKTMAATEHWLIPAEEVTFDTCLSTTIKSAVYVANWRGLKVVAKTVKDVSKTKLSVGSSLSDQSDSTAAIARHELMHEMRTDHLVK